MVSTSGSSDFIGKAPGGRRLIAVVYADMAGYSRLIGLDDLGTLERLRTVRNAVIDPAINEHGGRLVQTGGDSLLIVFDSIDGAVRCAVEIQQKVPEFDGDHPPDRIIRFRVGIDIGDVIADGTNLHGEATNVAARLQTECPVGRVCVSRAVRDHVHGRLDLGFEELGVLHLKNISRPVEAFVLLHSAPEEVATPRPLRPPVTPPTKQISLTVASLRNLGISTEHQCFVDSIIEDFVDDLGRFESLLVLPSDDRLRISNAAGATNATHDDADYLIQGSMRDTKDAVEVRLQLIDYQTSVRLWSERLIINFADMIDETIHRMAMTVLTKVFEDANRRFKIQQKSSPSDLMRRGYSLLLGPAYTGQYPEATRLFEQALISVPASIPARLGIVGCLMMDIADGLDSSYAAEERVEQLLLDMLRVDANIAIVHVFMGTLRRMQGRLDDSRIELDIAIQQEAHYPMAIAQLGVTEICFGNPQTGIVLIDKNLRLSAPDFSTPAFRSCQGFCHLLLGHVEEAIVSLKTARALNPLMPHIHLWLAAALGLMGELEEAQAVLAKAIEMRPEFASLPTLYALSRRPHLQFITLFERTIYVGLRLAGLPDIWKGSNERPAGWIGVSG
jgi:class 3 adenylate cyclase/TolB-like protein